MQNTTRLIGTGPERISYHGSKERLSPRLWALISPLFSDPTSSPRSFVEPFGGSGVMSAQASERGLPEVVYNELNHRMVHLLRTIQNPAHAAELARLCRAVEITEPVFDHCRQTSVLDDPTASPTERAFRMLVNLSNGRYSGCPFNNRTGYHPVKRLATFHLHLPRLSAAWQRIQISQRDAFEVIAERVADPNCLLFLDPTYINSTRASSRKYSHELTDDDHARLIRIVANAQARIMLCGHESDIYSCLNGLNGWHTAGFSGHVLRKERVWFNWSLSDPVALAGVAPVVSQPALSPIRIATPGSPSTRSS